MNPLRALFLTISRMPPAVMLAIIVGLAMSVTYMVTSSIQTKEDEFKKKTQAMTDQMSAKTTVVYSIKEIPEGQTIPSEALEERQIEAAKQPQDALNSATLAAGRIAKYGISTGQIVSQHDLLPQQIAMGFEARLKDGMRAVTFAVDNNSGVAGFVAPESHVDIISMVGSGADTKAKAVLSDVEVIAVGQNYQKNPGSSAAVPASSVTVSVTADDAQKLIKAVLASKLYLSLRSNSDHTPVATVDVTSLFAKTQTGDNHQVASLPSMLPPAVPGFSGQADQIGAQISPALPPVRPPYEIEAWSGSKKDVIAVPEK